MRPLLRFTLVALVLLVSCGPEPVPPWHIGQGYRWRELKVPSRGEDGFTELAASETGIVSPNDLDSAKAYANRHLMQGSGVALGDVDGDGLVDIYLSRIDGPNALYKNLGGWKFKDITKEAGVALGDRPSTGAVLVDVDGDGDLDLIVTSMGGKNTLFLNDGHGKFTDATAQSGFVDEARGSTTVTLADVDGNGTLDLFIANYKKINAIDLYPPQQRAFDQVVKQVGNDFQVVPAMKDDYKVIIRNDLHGVSMVQRADPDWFYLNDGKGHFTRVPLASPRFRDEQGRPLAEEPEYFGLVAKFYDVNGDGAPDLYIANDFEDPDQFFINDGKGNFQLIPRLAQRTTSNSGMALDFSDINRDGFVDFFEVDMLGRNSHEIKTQIPTHTPLQKPIGDFTDRPQWQRNTLQLNRGDNTFAQIAEMAGVTASGWSWGTLFMDVDLDGYEDLLIAAGHTWDLMDADTWEKIRNSVTGVDWHHERSLYPKLALPNVAFRNKGDLTFEDKSVAWGFGSHPAVSHGIAVADLDGDGDLDVVVNRLGSPAGVYRNNTTKPRLAVRLHGRAPNTEAVGANITVRGGPVPMQQKQVTVGGAYLSSSDPEYTFAATAGKELTIEVRWRNGGVTTIPNVKANRLYEIDEPANATPAVAVPSKPEVPLFTDVSVLLDHRHVEDFFDDFQRQQLLPIKLSQLGPGVTWYDVDGDGWEDLLIPSGAGGSLAYYRNEKGRFRKVSLGLPVAPFDGTSVLAVPGAAGGTTLLMGQSSYEAKSPAEALGIPGVVGLSVGTNGKAGGTFSVAHPDTTSVGPLAIGDYDGDGTLDLFVGGRVAPGVYPIAGNSRLFKNQAGTMVLDVENTALLRGVGLVSAAVFSDLNGDGWPDLLIATEWGPIKVFQNDHGHFRDVTTALGLDQYTGRWNGITTGDIDGDGRLDIIATNWGRNTRDRAWEGHPLWLYFGNLDHGNSLSVIEAQLDDRIKAIAPITTLSKLQAASRETRTRVPTFADFADASIERVVGPQIASMRRVAAATLDHMVFLNREDHFEARPLPVETQLAPAFYAGVADFNGDGAEDLVLSQNFFPTEINTPRYDAGRGLLLMGDGKGGLIPWSGQRSGILVYGDQRGAAFADYDHDGRIDLVVSQNGAETKMLHNQGATPGLRVRVNGGAQNPYGIGATIRLKYRDRLGPAREVHGGSGYWSQDGLVQVMGMASEVVGVWVRWPGGKVTETPVKPGVREVVVRQ